MKTTSNPIRSTIIYGLLCGLGLIPISEGLSHVVFWPEALYLTLWMYIAVYSFLLTHWSGQSVSSIIFPLLLILIALFGIDSMSLFWVLASAILGWIRSGICFPQRMRRRIIGELILGLGGAALMLSLTPASTLTWSLAIWMFFLVQALYFVIFETSINVQESIQRDPFEKAREQAENILLTGLW